MTVASLVKPKIEDHAKESELERERMVVIDEKIRVDLTARVKLEEERKIKEKEEEDKKERKEGREGEEGERRGRREDEKEEIGCYEKREGN